MVSFIWEFFVNLEVLLLHESPKLNSILNRVEPRQQGRLLLKKGLLDT